MHCSPRPPNERNVHIRQLGQLVTRCSPCLCGLQSQLRQGSCAIRANSEGIEAQLPATDIRLNLASLVAKAKIKMSAKLLENALNELKRVVPLVTALTQSQACLLFGWC